MNRTLLFIFISVFLFACVSTQTLINNGQYEAALEQSARKLARSKSNEKEVLALEDVYRKINERDRNRINFLKQEGNPENWDEIFRLYSRLEQRQERIKPLLPLVVPSCGRTAAIEIVNYNDEIVNAKQKAAEYYYAHGQNLLAKNDKISARNAYYDFKRVWLYYPNYKDVDLQLRQAEARGLTHVLFKMQNKSGIPLPPSFENELTRISLSDLNTEWVQYHVQYNEGVNYDYSIVVNMNRIEPGPEAIRDHPFVESKEVPDGFEYVLDGRGNVKKDSLGNDIKRPKIKTIRCNVLEKIQLKKAMISGTLEYTLTNPTELIKTDPIGAEHVFEHHSAMANGDLNALRPETKALLNSYPVPFPTDADMVLAAGQTLKNVVKDLVWRNKELIQ